MLPTHASPGRHRGAARRWKQAVLAALTVALGLTLVACSSGSGAESTVPAPDEPTPTAPPTSGSGIVMCDGQELPCPPWSKPVTLQLAPGERSGNLPDFPPQPQVAVAAFPGEQLDVTIEDFRPGDEAHVFSTLSQYDGARHLVGDDGTLSLPLFLPDGLKPGTYTFVIAQPEADGETGPAAGFIVTVIDRQASSDIPWVEILELAEGIELED